MAEIVVLLAESSAATTRTTVTKDLTLGAKKVSLSHPRIRPHSLFLDIDYSITFTETKKIKRECRFPLQLPYQRLKQEGLLLIFLFAVRTILTLPV